MVTFLLHKKACDDPYQTRPGPTSTVPSLTLLEKRERY